MPAINPRTRSTSAVTKSLPPNWQPVLPRVVLESGKLKDSVLNGLSHVVVLFPASLLVSGALPAGLPGGGLLKQVLARQHKKPAALLRVTASAGKMPVEPLLPEATLSGGGLIRWVAFDPDASAFLRHQQLRQALGGLLAEQPARLDVVIHGSAGFVACAMPDAAYVAAVNRAALPKTVAIEKPAKTTGVAKPTKLPEVRLWVGPRDQAFLKTLLANTMAKAQANTLT
ncbi:MAG: hypothetical protein ACO3AG_07190, partial [Fluviibacter sp.]